MKTIRVEMGKPWPLDQEWREKTTRLAEVTAELNAVGVEPVVDDTPPQPAPPALPSRSPFVSGK